MNRKEYSLANGTKLFQKKLSLRKLAAIASLLVDSLIGLFTGDKDISTVEISEIIKTILQNEEIANGFFTLVLTDKDGQKPINIDFMDEDAELLIGVVEDFFTLNATLIKQLKSMLKKLDLSKLTTKLSGSEPK